MTRGEESVFPTERLKFDIGAIAKSSIEFFYLVLEFAPLYLKTTRRSNKDANYVTSRHRR